MSEASQHLLSGAEKAALILLSLGPEQASSLLSGLPRRELRAVADHLRWARGADPSLRGRVIAEFRAAAAACAPGQEASSFAEDRPAQPPLADDGAVRPYDFSRLPRLSGQEASAAPGACPAGLGALGDLPVTCRARLAVAELTLEEIVSLGAGDVLLLGPASESGIELVAGDGCRLRGKLIERGGHRAIALDDEEAGGSESHG